MIRYLAPAAFLLALVGPALADSIDDAEAKRRGVPVAQVVAERQLAAEKVKTAGLEKQLAELQKQYAALQAGGTAPSESGATAAAAGPAAAPAPSGAPAPAVANHPGGVMGPTITPVAPGTVKQNSDGTQTVTIPGNGGGRTITFGAFDSNGVAHPITRPAATAPGH